MDEITGEESKCANYIFIIIPIPIPIIPSTICIRIFYIKNNFLDVWSASSSSFPPLVGGVMSRQQKLTGCFPAAGDDGTAKCCNNMQTANF
jgi:hypothetical protein